MDRLFVVCQGSPDKRRVDGARQTHPQRGECAVPQVRDSARRLLAMALEAELRHFLASVARKAVPCGGAVVRNGFHPERSIQTAIGPVPVRLPKVRRRGGAVPRFWSVLLPRYARRATGFAAQQACAAYLRAMIAGDAAGALGALLGPRILPAPVLKRLEDWRRGWLPSPGAYTTFDAQCGKSKSPYCQPEDGSRERYSSRQAGKP